MANKHPTPWSRRMRFCLNKISAFMMLPSIEEPSDDYYIWKIQDPILALSSSFSASSSKLHPNIIIKPSITYLDT